MRYKLFFINTDIARVVPSISSDDLEDITDYAKDQLSRMNKDMIARIVYSKSYNLVKEIGRF